MEHKQIEALLEKYWQGETSLSEEETLRIFFQSDTVPPHLKKEAELFSYYSISGKTEIGNPDFDESLISELEKNEEKQTNSFSWLKIAATFLLLFASVYLVYELNKSSSKQAPIVENTSTYEDPEAAYEQTRQALLLVSQKLNTPEKYTEEMGKFNDATTLFK